MKFGLSFLPDSSPQTKSPGDYFREAIELSCIADEKGLNLIKMTEHYLHPYGGYCPSPLIFLTAVAMRTKSIRLITGCILPAFHHPIQIASETAMLDCISNGRLEVGFGRAYLPYEFAAFGVDLDDSREKYTSTILATRDLWTQPQVSSHTKFFHYENVTILPKVIQDPHPPIWGAAVNSRQSFAWLGEQGFNLLISAPTEGMESLVPLLEVYRSSFYEKHPNRKPQIGLSLPLIIRKTEKEAIIDSNKYLQHYKDTWADATKEWNTTSSTNYPKYGGLSRIIRSSSPQLMRDRLQAIVGTPESVCEKILSIHELLKIDFLLWQIDFGSQPFESSCESLELFAHEVMPNTNKALTFNT